MTMNIKDLALFVEIASAPSLSLGAKRALLSPAAASARIKALELELNAQLLYRNSCGVMLTDAGSRLLVHARLVMQQLECLKSEFAEPGVGSFGRIKVVADTIAVIDALPVALRRFRADFPGVEIELQERNSVDVLGDILEGAADIGITTGPVSGPVSAIGLEVIPFSAERLVLAVAADHPLSRNHSVTLADTFLYSHVSLPAGSPLHELLKKHASQLGCEFAPHLQVASFESVSRLVEAGVGVAILPQSLGRRYRKAMSLHIKELSEPWAVLEHSVVFRDFSAHPGYTKSLISMLRSLH
ncbi:LysR family transcriptional regulator [Pseudomonas sp. NPDC089401]|uniref:LysR family transcriptional regulator n=1 Tax=Pseudomonas sp. NPDC089401 TaxID=3364462 RepID=UPI00382BDA0B